MFKSRIIALALTFLLLSSSTFAIAETSDEYFKGGSGSSQQSISLDGTNSDNSISINVKNKTRNEVIINFDNEQFNRLFFNLIKNSIESIEEKVKKTNKSLKNIDIEINQRRDYITINLIDTGEGFKDKKTKDIIKPYYTTKEKGTGLGLSIVDKIINDHNGSIKFLNTNNGAKVQIIIPK